MTAAERGFALLSSHLGDPERKCLTTAQLRQLGQRVQNAPKQQDQRQMEPRDLVALGYSQEMARRIIGLLEQEERLDAYLRQGKKAGCGLLTRVSREYPQALRTRLGSDAPGCLWYKGDVSILEEPKVALVGSRDILPQNAEFARQAGIQAAKQGFVLVSGNARGADRIAQEACLAEGGRVISIVADSLTEHPQWENLLYLSEDSFDAPFSIARALSRNRVIHAVASVVLVAQCGAKTGGTWDGTTRNLRGGWSSVCCFDDGTAGTLLLSEMGARKIGISDLEDLEVLSRQDPNLFDDV